MLRRSKRISEQMERNNLSNQVSVKKSRFNEELKKKELEALKNKLKIAQGNLSDSKNKLNYELRLKEILKKKLEESERAFGAANTVATEAKTMLGNYTKLTENQKQIIADMEGKMEDFKNQSMFNEALNREKATAESYKKKWVNMMNRAKNGEDENGPFPWKHCESCDEPYGDTDIRIPRVLVCGHTICTECAGKLMMNNNSIRCPVDRQSTKTENGRADELPKNFVLLNV
ncbi:hypothetical protein CRE_28660 [Caenorhabditis remanei]|uniref:RING-type domain-containing protein n=1 Tax=Caenorhabditis remanei TaxID=31234 RepID=E3MJW4_CAERE|nr:hypothetical protein CRE_28660 [Caenorhabditis remanei]